MKPFPNRTSTFQRIRLSPDHPPLRVGAFTESVMIAYCDPGSDLRLRDRLRPFALLRRYPQPWVVVTPPATTASLPRCQHWVSATLPLRELTSVPALLVSQVLCGCRCPFDPLTWRTTLGTSH